MRTAIAFLCCLIVLSACDKHDPILSGHRIAIFDGANITVANKTITDIPTESVVINNSACPYTQDSSNVIWDGDRRVFSGFSTNNTVAANPRPICSGKYIYAGLTTGEVIKLNPTTRQISWIADVYRTSNLTGGASMVDIIAPIVPDGRFVYAGGLGDAFCKLSAASGAKSWCLDIGVAEPFVIAGNYAFVVATDNNLYAISTSDGTIFWRTPVDASAAATYADGTIIVADQKFAVSDGAEIK